MHIYVKHGTKEMLVVRPSRNQAVASNRSEVRTVTQQVWRTTWKMSNTNGKVDSIVSKQAIICRSGIFL